MSENQSYEEKIAAIKKASLEASGTGGGDKKEDSTRAMESQRRDLERMEKIGAFQAGVKAAVAEWLTENKTEVLEAIGGKKE